MGGFLVIPGKAGEGRHSYRREGEQLIRLEVLHRLLYQLLECRMIVLEGRLQQRYLRHLPITELKQ